MGNTSARSVRSGGRNSSDDASDCSVPALPTPSAAADQMLDLVHAPSSNLPTAATAAAAPTPAAAAAAAPDSITNTNISHRSSALVLGGAFGVREAPRLHTSDSLPSSPRRSHSQHMPNKRHSSMLIHPTLWSHQRHQSTTVAAMTERFSGYSDANDDESDAVITQVESEATRRRACRIFEERSRINRAVCDAGDGAADTTTTSVRPDVQIGSASVSPRRKSLTRRRKLPMGGKTTAHRQRTVRKWCSWCYKRVLHGRVQKNRLLRSTYQCLNCVHRTLMCCWCSEGMVRGHSDYDDFLCARCDGTISEWGTVPLSDRTLGWCSWCFNLTSHGLRMTNFVRRNTYMCEECGGRTALCISCKRSFTRCNSLYDDKLCALCDGTIKDWKVVGENRMRLRASGVNVLSHDDPYQSMYPVRRHQYAKVLIDGKEFYSALADAIDMAQESVFMSFWHLNLKIHLRRPPGCPLRDEDRLDNMLLKKAKEGVKIYVILWRENVQALVNNFSQEMKRELNALHPNICAIRHGHPSPLTEYFCHHQKFAVVDQDVALLGGLDVCLGRYDDPMHRLTDEKSEVWLGVDYYNPHLLKPTSASIKTPEVDVIDRQVIPRMPWHDVDIEVHGQVARDVARNFIERWNHHVAQSYSNHGYDVLQPNTSERYSPQTKHTGTCAVQLVRSMDSWSGASRLDRSIYGAYMNAVSGAQHLIYIENQYLSSNIAGGGVKNVVMNRIMQRVREKISAGQTFRVIIVLPQPEETGDSAMELLRWQYQTINRGGCSLLEQLNEEFPNVDLEAYISFFFLRQHAMINGVPTTEKVFTHSKLMIVDDRIAILSSANFNDRSLLGDRDSELGVIIEDEDFVDITMNGQPFKAGRFPHQLRMRLWQEHLGLSDEHVHKIVDPTCEAVFKNIWLETARHNTRIYEKIFPSIPQNSHTSMKIFKQAGGLDVPAKAVTDGHELREIRGLLTMHPIGFLLDEEISTIISAFLGDVVAQ